MSDPLYSDDQVTLYLGKCEEQLKAMPANSVHAVICDPPYGMSVEPKMEEVLKHWLAGDDYVHKGSGFMGRSWDSFVPGPSIWREIYRVLKPGGMLAAFASTRTADLMGIAIRLAGFERRDTILHIGSEVYVCDEVEFAWLYGSGFPKEGDLGVAVDRHLGFEPEVVTRTFDPSAVELGEEFGEREEAVTRTSGIGAAYSTAAASEEKVWQANAGQQEVQELEPVSEEGLRWRGWSTALKPANEPIILARKPMSEKTVPANVLKHGVGAYNIAEASIGNDARVNYPSGTRGDTEAAVPKRAEGATATAREGRWPPNVIMSHTEDCVLVEVIRERSPMTREVGPSSRPHQGVTGSGSGENAGMQIRVAHVDPDGMESVEVWACAEGCPVREIDVQGATERKWKRVRSLEGEGFTAGVTRFFYCAKPTRAEKDAGITSEPEFVANRAGGSGIAKDDAARAGGGEIEARILELVERGLPREAAEKAVSSKVKNTHLTVKPIALMEWLIKLLCPPGGVVLDPFMGSGTTGCAAMRLGGFRFVGCEMTPEHVTQAMERILYWRDRASQEGQGQLGMFD